MKKTNLIKMYLAGFMVSMLIPNLLFAQPEQIKIQSDELKAKKTEAKTLAQSVDLSKVEDPQVKTALEVIFQMLDLKAKK